jgi:hypothetical protein
MPGADGRWKREDGSNYGRGLNRVGNDGIMEGWKVGDALALLRLAPYESKRKALG